MELQKRLKTYLKSSHMMQLATVSGDQPWCCTVYYIFDDDLNLYWASLPTRRHSQEIVNNKKIAAAIPINFINGEKVIGIQIEGTAELIENPKLIEPLAQQYAKKFGKDKGWIQDFTDLKTDHRLYKLTPSLFVLFDEVNYPRDTRLEFKP